MAMTRGLNETHDPNATSWVKSANREDSPFPIQNLPLGVFRINGERPRIGVAIGDSVLDLHGAAEANLLDVSSAIQSGCQATLLNELMGLTSRDWSDLRRCLFRLLHQSSATKVQQKVGPLLVPQDAVQMELPCRIGDYTDFYAGIHHATNVGKLFRPDNPLLPNYKWIPIAYHGRSSSIVASGALIRRPSGQTKSAEETAPTFGPTRKLDYELELAFYIGSGNGMGSPISIDQAEANIFGVCLLNDWSARDIQTWEYQPLGPFLAKNFATTVSPWIITVEALAPFRCPAFVRPEADPQPLPYLHSRRDQQEGGVDISIEVALSTQEMRDGGLEPYKLCRSSSRDLYWTMSQLVAHHTSNGCNLRPGDIMGSGTISGSSRDSSGSLLELTRQGSEPIDLPNGQRRTFLENGDEVILSAWCRKEGRRAIGFGGCRGRIEA